MGKLRIIEGMDGSGTTTVTKMLANYSIKLGYQVSQSAEPTNSAIGQEIQKNAQRAFRKTTLFADDACFMFCG